MPMMGLGVGSVHSIAGSGVTLDPLQRTQEIVAVADGSYRSGPVCTRRSSSAFMLLLLRLPLTVVNRANSIEDRFVRT